MSEKKYQIQENELIVLSAFFLAIPLPPLVSGEPKNADESAEDVLVQTTQQLLTKELILSETAAEKKNLVQPELAQILKDIAYASKALHLFSHTRDQETQQNAWYWCEDRVVQQELLDDATHLFSYGDKDMGLADVEDLLASASQGRSGQKARIRQETWNYLITSRAGGIAEEVLKLLDEEKIEADSAYQQTRDLFIRDVLDAKLILQIDAVYDRISNKGEQLSFVVTEDNNWLLTSATPVMDEATIWAIQVKQKEMKQALAGIYSPLGLSLYEGSIS